MARRLPPPGRTIRRACRRPNPRSRKATGGSMPSSARWAPSPASKPPRIQTFTSPSRKSACWWRARSAIKGGSEVRIRAGTRQEGCGRFPKRLLLPHLESGKVARCTQLHLADDAEQKDPTCRPILGYGRSVALSGVGVVRRRPGGGERQAPARLRAWPAAVALGPVPRRPSGASRWRRRAPPPPPANGGR